MPLGFLHSFLIMTLTFYDAQNGLVDHAVTSALVIALVDGFTNLPSCSSISTMEIFSLLLSQVASYNSLRLSLVWRFWESGREVIIHLLHPDSGPWMIPSLHIFQFGRCLYLFTFSNKYECYKWILCKPKWVLSTSLRSLLCKPALNVAVNVHPNRTHSMNDCYISSN